LQGGLPEVGVVVSLDKVEEVGDEALPPAEGDLDGGDGGDDLACLIASLSVGGGEGGEGVVLDLLPAGLVEGPPTRLELVPPALLPGLERVFKSETGGGATAGGGALFVGEDGGEGDDVKWKLGLLKLLELLLGGRSQASIGREGIGEERGHVHSLCAG
jgi:hypothetical protein